MKLSIFRNKFFLIGLSLALALTVFAAVLGGMGRTDILGGAVRTVTYPLRLAATKCADAIRGFGSYFGASKEQSDELESLRNALRDARDKADEYDILLAENERLRAYLGIRAAHPDFTFEEALVVGRSTEKYAPVLTLNRGSLHGISVGMPVMTPDGLVGYVSEVGLTDCRVRTLLSGDVSVGACVERSGVSGVVTGRLTLDGTGECYSVMEYLESGIGTETDTEPDTEPATEADSGTDTQTDTESESESETASEQPDYLALYGIDVKVGDVIRTSGVGAVYPAGLEIGKVKEIRVDRYSRKLTLVIELSASLDRDLTYALILTGTGASE